MLCSEILNLYLQPRVGRERKVKANGGRKFQPEAIARTRFRGLGYFVEIRFHRDCIWPERKYRPPHLSNPLLQLANRIFEATLYLPESSFSTPRPATLLRSLAASSRDASRS
jgi:hypothetical protein